MPPESAPGSAGVRGAGDVAVRMVLPSVAANAALARQALAGLTDDLGVEAASAVDLRAAITAAWTDAIHRQDGSDDPLEVTMALERDQLVLTVGSAEPEPWPPTGISIVLAPGSHVSSVLGRVVSLVSARVGFSIDRLSDAQIVSDAIAGSAAARTPGGLVRVRIEEHGHGFELVVGPLVRGGARRVLADTELPGLGCLVERLADRVGVEQRMSPGELLRVCLDRPSFLRLVPAESEMFEH
jgi:hypothetical protein